MSPELDVSTAAPAQAPRPALTAAVVQDAASGRVLMLGWMDAEAERLTRETGQVWFWSRSRQRLWRKGECSGNTLTLAGGVQEPPSGASSGNPAAEQDTSGWSVVELHDDCDGDALLVRVEAAGPTCHTGSVSCFAPELWRTVAQRAQERPVGSYVTSLLASGTGKVAQKVGEEAVETVVAALSETDERVVEEAADLVFHLYVLLAARGIDLSAVDDELRRRASARRAPDPG